MIPAHRTRIVDLTYAISGKLPAWPGDKRTYEAKDNATVARDGYFTRSFWMLEHFGTHLDAPIHFPPGRRTVDRIPAERLFGPAVVIDVVREGRRNADYELTVERLRDWEKRHGRIRRGAIVLLRTGWGARMPDAKRYLNLDAQGRMRSPGFSVAAVKVLLKRGISGLGIDTMSVDAGVSADYPVHTLVLGSDLYQLENLANLGKLPETGAYLVVAPIKLEGGSGGPCRVFALVPAFAP